MKFRYNKEEKEELTFYSVIGLISLSPFLVMLIRGERLMSMSYITALLFLVHSVFFPISVVVIFANLINHKYREDVFDAWVERWGKNRFRILNFPIIYDDGYQTLLIDYDCDYYDDLGEDSDTDNYKKTPIYVLDDKIKPALMEMYKKASCNSETIEIYKSLASEMLLLYNSLNDVVKKIINAENPHIRKKYEDHLQNRIDDIVEHINSLSSKFDDIYLYEKDKKKAGYELEYEEMSRDTVNNVQKKTRYL